jgi:uncharacterized repeat protein (TIGR03803 family)
MRITMKSNSIGNYVSRSLIIAACSCLISSATAQTLTTLHHFSALSDSVNTDGAYPIQPALVATRNVLYGVTTAGGIYGEYNEGGTVFEIQTNGSGFQVIYSFNLNDDGIGAYPFVSGLTLYSNLLYGTTRYGDSDNYGAVYSINTNNNDATLLYNFGMDDVFAPVGALALSADGAMIYGSLTGDLNGEVYSLNRLLKKRPISRAPVFS